MGLLDINEVENSLNETVLFKLKVKEYIRCHFFENEEFDIVIERTNLLSTHNHEDIGFIIEIKSCSRYVIKIRDIKTCRPLERICLRRVQEQGKFPRKSTKVLTIKEFMEHESIR